MMSFSTGQVESLLGLPASTLRFWEKEVPFLAPRKDVFGRRVYSATDLCVLSRLKYLAFAKGLGLKSACKAMEAEMVAADPSLRAEIIEIKTRLFSLSAQSRSLHAALEDSMEGIVADTRDDAMPQRSPALGLASPPAPPRAVPVENDGDAPLESAARNTGNSGGFAE